MRISGVQLPDKKRIETALTYVYGIGSSRISVILAQAKVDADRRVKDLSDEETNRIQKEVDRVPTEGELRQQIRENIQRLKTIGSYRGKRHQLNLPTRGQRTRTNARSGRGRRQTVGSQRKTDRLKTAKSDSRKGK